MGHPKFTTAARVTASAVVAILTSAVLMFGFVPCAFMRGCQQAPNPAQARGEGHTRQVQELMSISSAVTAAP